MICGDRRQRFFFEADEEEEAKEAQPAKEETPAEEENDEDGANEPKPAEEDNEEEQEEDQEATDQEDTEEDKSNEDNPDFSIDADMEPSENEGGEEGTADDNNEPAQSNPEEKPIDNEDKKRDRELFASLSPQEQKMKTAQLKKLFIELHSNCDYTIDKMNIVGTNYEEINVQLKKTLSVLFNLKQMITDYTLNLFDSKSYIENDIMFNRYLLVLNTVKNITKDIVKQYQDENTKK